MPSPSHQRVAPLAVDRAVLDHDVLRAAQRTIAPIWIACGIP
jgi:hypothetical protein